MRFGGGSIGGGRGIRTRRGVLGEGGGGLRYGWFEGIFWKGRVCYGVCVGWEGAFEVNGALWVGWIISHRLQGVQRLLRGLDLFESVV